MSGSIRSWLTVTPFGAAGGVTGSCNYVEVTATDGSLHGYMVDAGLFAGKNSRKMNTNISFLAKKIKAAFATHPHVDHIGRFPYLYRQGYRGPIYATEPAIDLAAKVLPDAGKIQEENYKFFLQKSGLKNKGLIAEIGMGPLYTAKDGTDVMELFVPVERGETVKVDDYCEACFYNAGHGFGSASVMLTLTNGEESHKLYFSGDIGQNSPLLKARKDSFKTDVDFVFMESTYADRFHRPRKESWEELREISATTLLNGGNVVHPCFSAGRTQSIWFLYYLDMMTRNDWIADVFRKTIFHIDSQLSVLATRVFSKHPEEFNAKAARAMKDPDNNPFCCEQLEFCLDVEESKVLTSQKNNYVVFSAAGMCNAGRVLYHLEKDLPNPNSAVIFTGYQAEGTLGRQLIEGAKQVKIHGESVFVRAKVASITGFSDHVDQDGLVKWLKNIEEGYTLFIGHGEPEPQEVLKTRLIEEDIISEDKVELLGYGKCYHLYKGGFEVTTFSTDTKKEVVHVDQKDTLLRKEICKLEHFHELVSSVLEDPFDSDALQLLHTLEQEINAELARCKKKRRQGKPNKSRSGARRR